MNKVNAQEPTYHLGVEVARIVKAIEAMHDATNYGTIETVAAFPERLTVWGFLSNPREKSEEMVFNAFNSRGLLTNEHRRSHLPVIFEDGRGLLFSKIGVGYIAILATDNDFTVWFSTHIANCISALATILESRSFHVISLLRYFFSLNDIEAALADVDINVEGNEHYSDELFEKYIGKYYGGPDVIAKRENAIDAASAHFDFDAFRENIDALSLESLLYMDVDRHFSHIEGGSIYESMLRYGIRLKAKRLTARVLSGSFKPLNDETLLSDLFLINQQLAAGGMTNEVSRRFANKLLAIDKAVIPL